jgi:hypothetical protein
MDYVAWLTAQQVARIARNRAAAAREKDREKAASKRRVEESVKRIDHEIRLASIRRRAEQRRRAEEASSVEAVEWLMKRWRGRGGGVMQVDIAEQWLRMHREASGPPIEPYHSLFCNYVRARGRVVRWTSTAGVNAYFLPGDGSIELWPIRSQRSAAVAWHEEAHAQTPCRTQQPPHVRVKNVGCVRCEVSAWELAAQIALPEFTPDMHNEMTACIRTYRKHGTPDEQREIDRMCTSVWFENVQRKRR